ncbi:MAG: 2-oxoacid:acceptor oxidoreductase family protein [Candidatus Omnitrophota bacterium]|jgi:2-oxoglutarate ferredoxin oxidoreductase subunit gamma
MREGIIIAGSGGQGVMLLGKILAEAAMRENRQVTWLPAYGAEVRGGTAYCMVTISDKGIGSPYIEKADALIIMNGPSWEKFKQRIKNKGLVLVNSSLADKNIEQKNVFILKYPFTELALKLGNIKVANVIALGCYLAKNKIIGLETVLKVIKDMAPRNKKELARINEKALLKGRDLIKLNNG